MGEKLGSENLLSTIKVSRETISDFNEYKSFLLKNNIKFNLLSKNDEKIVDQRHILDSMQIIDLIDKKSKKCIDLGSGAGFPGIIIAIMLKNINALTKIYLYEKSPKKSDFLLMISEKLDLNTSVVNRNILNERGIETNSIMARAFKPVSKIFQIINENFKKYENLILFLGKKGKQNLIDASKVWEFEYKERVSTTSKDSLIVNIKNIKKKIE